MNAKSAVFASLSIKPHKIKELIDKLPYSRHTIYKALELLAKDRLITKRNEKGKVLVEISKDYTTQKLREIYIKALSYGVDPEIFLRETTSTIWKHLAEPRTLRKIQKITGFSYLWVRKIVKFLVDSNLAIYKKQKPMIIVLNQEHELNILLKQYTKKKVDVEKVYYEWAVPFERLIKTPTEIEEILYQKIDGSLTIRDTGFMIRGKDKLSIVESVEKELGTEELFLHDIKTQEGIEDFCIRLIVSGKLNYEKLLNLAKKHDMVNIIGCYLDILNDIKEMIAPDVLWKFHNNISKRKGALLKQEKRYGKSGWEDKYEEKWNVNLYLDIGAIRHGVRSL